MTPKNIIATEAASLTDNILREHESGARWNAVHAEVTAAMWRVWNEAVRRSSIAACKYCETGNVADERGKHDFGPVRGVGRIVYSCLAGKVIALQGGGDG